MTPETWTMLRNAALAFCADAELPERLERAHVHLSGIDAERELPETLRFRFQELLADVAYGADTVVEAVALMSRGDRERLAERVVALYAEAARLLPPEG